MRRGQQGCRGGSAGPGIAARVVRITDCIRATVTACISDVAGHGTGYACGTGHAGLAGREILARPAGLAPAESAARL